MKRLLAFIPLIVLAALVGVFGYFNFHKKTEYQPRELVGQPVPIRALPDLKTAELRDLKTIAATYDKPIVVNIFASWCTPCLAEHPFLLDMKSKGAVIIGIAYKDTPVNSLNYLVKHRDPYAVVISDEPGDMGLDLGISGVPETYIVRPDGVIIDKVTGPLDQQRTDELLAKITSF
ncbi:redoxin family protein [Asticcacaulis sp. ZE23SCel15]|uniref:redoxin family protein n=1 Tax=Asticcacaulis sp. ZE23SCel15 TaxID=3059027 RepID=UPI00265F7CA4|nr:redoxin family protein [Asticcacaulis sp. ZE23SCel15]WKL57942.1 redoxin family protein [Asticcacaulis sp. ZE23SCel15]